MEFSQDLALEDTPIEGLKIIRLQVFGDNRGWFKENWQREKLAGLGLEDFGPIQNNISYNATAGVTRGLHAEPWDKFISVATGSVFGAWCDLREGSDTFGQVFTTIITPDVAVFVPRGVANGFQALEPTAYTYLVNDHWSPTASYSFVNLADPALEISWPIPLEKAELSEKDKGHPLLVDATPVPPRKVLITGGGGQLGQALSAMLPGAEATTRAELDLTSSYSELASARRWADYSVIINAAAFTAVDAAETTDGRAAAWAVNAHAVANLSRLVSEHRLTLVHVSSDYVFDGWIADHSEDEGFTPLSVYGQSKAAGDIAAMSTSKHYLVRTSWVVGQGKNFVSTMAALASRDVSPQVVNDQTGRLTFTKDLAAGIVHLLRTKAPHGTYNLSNTGDVVSWAEIAAEVYRHLGKDPSMVTPTSTEEYFADKENIAPRPAQSSLDLSKIEATGFAPRDWREALAEYLEGI